MHSPTNSPTPSVSKTSGQRSLSYGTRKAQSSKPGATLAAEMTGDKSQESSKSAAAKSTQMRSAQALSFWSMRFITVADLACAVATVLAIAVLILSLTIFVDKVPGSGTKNVVVRCRFGRVLGLSYTVFGHTDVYAFLGVPYAHPPLGEMRFRRSFTDFDVARGSLIDGTGPKPACVQSSPDKSLSEISEDCLHLSIWTTSRQCDYPRCANKAVLVFLHDGFFQMGGNRQPLYDGKYLAAYGDVVVVVPNYRLGALGFLNDGTGSAPGNAGLYDQLLALEWTRDNIGSFGGNVSNLVLVGYGAGAAAAGYLLFGEAAGVIDTGAVPKRVILMSGSPYTRYPDNTELKSRRVVDQARRLHCVNDSRADIKCLRSSRYWLFAKTAAPPLFFPSFTGIIPSPPRQWMQEKEPISDAEILLGHMDDESPLATQFVRLLIAQQENLPDVTKVSKTIFEALNISSDILKVIDADSKVDNWITMSTFTKLLADLLVICPVRDMGRLLASAGNNRVFRYLVSTKTAANATEAKMGDMLRLVFGAHFLSPVELAALARASEAIIGFWTHFARTGRVPNTNGYGKGRFSISITPEEEASVLDIRKEQCQLLSSFGI
ncbi:hypothetical protein HPB51_026196 [Rhipicephalus microplus]|uniref:Carboxylesterase type B domain-containing protein n=1 Tax=Rhipicephalus microplus TaxID=6941 RepID=A0A9J6DXG1_RHIMP|nr:hypothetical protein HPB51_026196 [Rhipicephalus microplus]